MKIKKILKDRKLIKRLNKAFVLIIIFELFYLTTFFFKFYRKKPVPTYNVETEVKKCLEEGKRYTIDEAVENPQVCDVEVKSVEDLAKLSLNSENLSSVQTVYFRETPQTSLPPEISNIVNLTVLNFHHTVDTSLPPEIGNLKNLKVLNLNKTDIKYIPAEIGNLTSLTSLTISNNEEKIVIPPEIGKLKQLKTLSLSNNPSVSIPGELADIRSMEELDLAGSNFTEIPAAVYKLPSLKILNLRDNRIPKSLIKNLQEKLPTTEIVY